MTHSTCLVPCVDKFSGLWTEPREDQPVDDSLTVGAGTGPSDMMSSDLGDDHSRGIHNRKAAKV